MIAQVEGRVLPPATIAFRTMQRDGRQAQLDGVADARRYDVVLICLFLPIIAVSRLALVGVVAQLILHAICAILIFDRRAAFARRAALQPAVDGLDARRDAIGWLIETGDMAVVQRIGRTGDRGDEGENA